MLNNFLSSYYFLVFYKKNTGYAIMGMIIILAIHYHSSVLGIKVICAFPNGIRQEAT